MKRKPVPVNKICTICQQVLPVSEFYQYRKDGEVYYMPYCKTDNKKRLAAWRAANPERVRAAQREQYRRRHPVASTPG